MIWGSIHFTYYNYGNLGIIFHGPPPTPLPLPSLPLPLPSLPPPLPSPLPPIHKHM